MNRICMLTIVISVSFSTQGMHHRRSKTYDEEACREITSTIHEKCAICHDNFSLSFHNGKQEASLLECGHIYHTTCIAPWIAACSKPYRTPNCPLCKMTIEHTPFASKKVAPLFALKDDYRKHYTQNKSSFKLINSLKQENKKLRRNEKFSRALSFGVILCVVAVVIISKTYNPGC